MNLVLTSYNLERAQIALVRKLLFDKPYLCRRELAMDLGITERTLNRWVKEKVKVPSKETRIILKYEDKC